MKKLRVCITLIFLLFFPSIALSSHLISEHVLENGLKIIVIEDHKAPLATFQIWYKVGSMHEPAGKTGVSHLLEHMMFKGTKKYGSKQFSNIIQRNGGMDNAFTTKDHTVYYQNLSSDRINLSIELEADRMTNLLLDHKEVISERNVVMEERRMRYDDDPQNYLYEEAIAAAFKAHPYRWPVIGWMSDIESIERDDLLNHYRAYYSPDNAFIVVSGDVNTNEIVQKIKKEFGSIPKARIKRNTVSTKESTQIGERRIYVKKEAELPFVAMAYHTPVFPHKDSFALEVLSNILSAGKSSRLYKSLVYEQKIALSVYADYSGFYKDPFLFFFGASAVAGGKIEDVEKAILEEIRKIKDKGLGLEELQKAKNQIEASFIFEKDSNSSMALTAGTFELLGGLRLMDSYLEGIRKVTAQDVQAAAKKYLIDDNKTTGILIPIKRVETK
jgi:zinc protease